MVLLSNLLPNLKIWQKLSQEFSKARKDTQVGQLLNILVKRVVVWCVIFLALWLFSSSLIQTIALGMLAVTLTSFVITVSWHFLPKEYIPNLQEKAVIITGCDSGFGNKLAQKLDKKGMTVYAGCLFPEAATLLKKSCSDRLKIFKLDVTSDEDVENAVKTVTSSLGNKKLWAVINNAGIAIGGEVEWTSVEICKKTIEVNAIGPYRVTKAFLPLLRKSQGRVVIVVSILGRVSTTGSGPYCMSKYGAAAFADSLRAEMTKWNVSVHTVEPWLYSTNITNEKTIAQDLRKGWDSLPKDVQKDYGENYCEDFQKAMMLTIGTKRPESKVHEVVDALEHAAIGEDPKTRYVPGLIGHIWTWILRFPSVELYTVISHFITPRNVKVRS